MISKLVGANISLLEQCKASFLEKVSLEVYTDISQPPYPFSVGAQVRHNLDMYDCLIRDYESRLVDFPNRKGAVLYEQDPLAAIEYIERIKEGLEPFEREEITTPLTIRVEPDVNVFVEIPMTLGGVLGFVYYHTMHHHATIAVLAAGLGQAIEDKTFGYNPTTLRTKRDFIKLSHP